MDLRCGMKVSVPSSVRTWRLWSVPRTLACWEARPLKTMEGHHVYFSYTLTMFFVCASAPTLRALYFQPCRRATRSLTRWCLARAMNSHFWSVVICWWLSLNWQSRVTPSILRSCLNFWRLAEVWDQRRLQCTPCWTRMTRVRCWIAIRPASTVLALVFFFTWPVTLWSVNMLFEARLSLCLSRQSSPWNVCDISAFIF